MMEFRDGMFQLVLGGYPFAAVREAFIGHVQRKSDLPTPSDIVNLIDPPPAPLSQAVYIDIRKRAREVNQYITREEKAYVRAFEEQEMAKVRGGSGEYRDATREVEAASNRAAIGYDGDYE